MVGAGSRGGLPRVLLPTPLRHCLAHASCPVLAVPPSPLQRDLEAVHHRNTWRLPLAPGHPGGPDPFKRPHG